MFDVLRKLFGIEEKSKDTAVKRLQFVLVHDRAAVQPEVMDKIREEVIAVITKYMDIERNSMEITLANGDKDNSVALVANIPVARMKHDGVKNSAKINEKDNTKDNPGNGKNNVKDSAKETSKDSGKKDE